jgi:hypothetical protein
MSFNAYPTNNLTLYYNVLNYWKTIMSNHPSLEQTSQGDIFGVDDNEYPKYPIGNVSITNVDFSDSTTIYTIQLIIADKVKLKNNESYGERNRMVIPFEGTDDVIDIWANTLAIINDLVSYTQYSVDTTGIAINSVIKNTPFQDNFDNGLAGFVSTFDIIVHNNRNRCLFNLLETSEPSPINESVYSQVVSFTTPMNSINYKCNGEIKSIKYGSDSNNLTDLVAMFNSLPTFTQYGTYYNNGDGRVRLEMPVDVYQSFCFNGTVTLQVFYD